MSELYLSAPVSLFTSNVYSLVSLLRQFLLPALVNGLYLARCKKYENEFDSFITTSGGSDNACTQGESTTFQFDIPEKYLSESLDRFAQFFISPLLKTESIDSEREVVLSEFQMHLPCDSNRRDQLIASCAQENHPASMFSYGNLDTLKNNITTEQLHEELQKFRERHYSAHRMTLAVQASLPLDTIEKYVKECFINIPSNDLPPSDFTFFKGPSSFDTPKFHKIYRFKPNSDICKLEFTWVMQSFRTCYESKPTYNVAWIIGHEGKGSLLNYLRKKLWAFELTAGTGSNFTHNTMYALFRIEIVLSDEGYKHIEEICDATFSYINMLKQAGPQKRIYDEIHHIEETIFRFAPDSSPIENVQTYCQAMHLYPPRKYITGTELLFKYDPENIAKCMYAFDPDKVNIMIYDQKSSDDKFDQIEPWFKTRYYEEEIPREWVERWKNIEPRPEFHLPEPNAFLTTDFSLVPLPEYVPDYPVKIYQDSLIKIWHKLDPKFRSPECCISLSLKTPLMDVSPQNSVMGDLMNTIVQQMITEEVYPATCTKLEHILCTSPRGIVFMIYGWSQKLPLLLHTIIRYYINLPNVITEDMFNAGKEQDLKWFHNEFIDINELKGDLRKSILMLNHWSRVVKYAALSDINFEQFLYFLNHLVDYLEITFLVQGNMTEEDAIHHGLKCAQILQTKPLLPETRPWTRITLIPPGEHCLRVKNFDASNVNSVVVNYYQAEDTSLRTKAVIDILITIMYQPLYNQLRTRQHLGYAVGCEVENSYGIYGFSIVLFTQANKYCTSLIDEKIEEFISDFKETLKTMSTVEFDQIKETLIKLKETEDNNLRDEFHRNWIEVELDRFAFDRLEQDKKVMQEIGVDEMREWLENHSFGGHNFRKISIQIVGNLCEEDNEQEDEDKSAPKKDNYEEDIDSQNYTKEDAEVLKPNNIQNPQIPVTEENNNSEKSESEEVPHVKYEYEMKYPLQYLTNLEDQTPKPDKYYITNIEDFKATLQLFPVKYTSY